MAFSIGPVGGVSAGRFDRTLPVRETEKVAESGKGTFGNVVTQALDSLQSLQARADAAAVDYVAGGQTELHDVMIATEQANLGFQLTLQLRNKVVEAYQEIMRMQV